MGPYQGHVWTLFGHVLPTFTSTLLGQKFSLQSLHGFWPMFIVCKLFVTMSGPCLNHSESQNGLNREIIFDLPLFPDQHGSFKTESIEFKACEKGMCTFWTLSGPSLDYVGPIVGLLLLTK